MAVTRFLLVSTHTEQTTGYAKVSYNLLKQLATLHPIVKVFHFGFQNNPGKKAGSMRPLPDGVLQYDAALNENPQEDGFGFNKIQEYIDTVNPDIVMIYNDPLIVNKFFSAMGLLKDDAPKPSYKVWVYLDQVYNGILSQLTDNIDNLADCIFTFTDAWKDKLVTSLNNAKDKVYSFEHGFDRNVFKPLSNTERSAIRRNLGVPEDATVFLNANRNSERKRLDLSICSFVELLVRNPDANICLLMFTTVSNGTYNPVAIYETELKRRGLKIEDQQKKLLVIDTAPPNIFTDEVMNQIYNITNVGINTSNGEGYGLCQLEHLATGAPQVVSDVGDYHSFMDESCAVFVKPTVIEYLPAKFGIGTYTESVTITDFANGMEKALLLDSTNCIRKIEKKSWARVCDPFLEMVAQACVKN